MMDETINSEKVATADDSLKRRQTMHEGLVGDLEESGEFGLGIAPREAKPVAKIEISKEKEAEIAAMQHWEPVEEVQDEVILQQEENAMLMRMRKKKNQNAERRPAIDKQVAFREYKQTEAAAAVEQEILQSRQRLKATRTELATKTETVNAIKSEIDQVKSFLDMKTEEKNKNALQQSLHPGITSHTDGFEENGAAEQAEIIDEDELQRLRELKELKKQYRENFLELKELQKEIRFTQQAIDSQKSKLINEFEEWYAETFEDERDMMADTSAGASNAGGSRGGQTGAASRMAAQPKVSLNDTAKASFFLTMFSLCRHLLASLSGIQRWTKMWNRQRQIGSNMRKMETRAWM